MFVSKTCKLEDTSLPAQSILSTYLHQIGLQLNRTGNSGLGSAPIETAAALLSTDPTMNLCSE